MKEYVRFRVVLSIRILMCGKREVIFQACFI